MPAAAWVGREAERSTAAARRLRRGGRGARSGRAGSRTAAAAGRERQWGHGARAPPVRAFSSTILLSSWFAVESIADGPQRPVKVASRPSKNAVTPSRRSSVPMLSAIPWRSSCRWSASELSRLSADQPLRHPHVVGRLRGELARPSSRRRSSSSSAGDDLRDDAHLERVARRSAAGRSSSSSSARAGPDHPRQEVGHPAVGRGADPAVGADERRRPRRRSGCRTSAPARSRRRPRRR